MALAGELSPAVSATTVDGLAPIESGLELSARLVNPNKETLHQNVDKYRETIMDMTIILSIGQKCEKSLK